ncbi:hypothetical protein ACFQVA_27575 [Actinomadura keratinilytica]
MPSPSEPGATPELTAPSEHKVRTLDPRSLRGLAHPCACGCSGRCARAGPRPPPNSPCAGRVERRDQLPPAPARRVRLRGGRARARQGRERWWRATSQGIRLEPDRLNLADPVQRGAVDVLMHEVADNHTEELSTWLGTRHEWPTAWQEAYDLSDYSYRLTPAQAMELRERAGELLESFRAYEAQNADAEDAAPYRVHLHGFPRKTSPSHPDSTEAQS